MFYFSTERPISPGSLPRHLKPLSIENFPEKIYCPEIEGEAWGKVEFDRLLTGYEATLSDLVPSGSKHYFGIKYARTGSRRGAFVLNESGGVKHLLICAHGINKPSDRESISIRPCKTYTFDIWFHSEIERNEFVEYLNQEAASYEDQH